MATTKARHPPVAFCSVCRSAYPAAVKHICKPRVYLCPSCSKPNPPGIAGKCTACVKGAEYAVPLCPDCGEHGGKNRPTKCKNVLFHIAGIGGVK